MRSSCDASETSCRCARAESSSAASIVLKLAARRLSSSRPCASMRRDRSRVSVTSSVVRVRRRTGASAAPATREPESRRDGDPAAGDEEQQQLDPAQRLVRLVERAREHQSPSPRRRSTGRSRHREDANLRARDASLAKNEPPRRAASRTCAPGGKRLRLVDRQDGSSVLANRLDDRRRPEGARNLEVQAAESVVDVRRAGARRLRQRVRLRPEPLVDLPVELSSHDEPDDDRRGHDCERDRACGRECQPGAKAHRSRRA